MARIVPVAAFFGALCLIGIISVVGYGLFGGDVYAPIGEPVTRDGLTVTLRRTQINSGGMTTLEFLISGLEENPRITGLPIELVVADPRTFKFNGTVVSDPQLASGTEGPHAIFLTVSFSASDWADESTFEIGQILVDNMRGDSRWRQGPWRFRIPGTGISQ